VGIEEEQEEAGFGELLAGVEERSGFSVEGVGIAGFGADLDEEGVAVGVDGMDSLQDIGSSILVSDNPVLEDLDGMSALGGPVAGFVIIDNNPALLSTGGLDGITSARGVSVWNDPQLVELGLGSLVSTEEYLRVGCTNMPDLDGLWSLQTVGTELTIWNNTQMASLAGLQSLETVVERIKVPRLASTPPARASASPRTRIQPPAAAAVGLPGRFTHANG